MSRLSAGIRSKRFFVKSKHELYLVIDSMSGEQFRLQVVDCSLTGIATVADGSINDDHLAIGDIVPSAKLCWGDRESSLGRLVLRRTLPTPGGVALAFSTVDSRVPVNGALSHILEVDLSENNSGFELELNHEKFNLAHFVENEYTNCDLFSRIDEFGVFFKDWSQGEKYAYRNIRSASKGERISMLRKRKNGRSDYLMMASNDYLGLSSHPKVIEAIHQTVDIYGFGSTGSPVTTGQTDLHEKLCTRLADMFGKESALLFNSGYTTNIGIISSITSANDLIVADQLAHASIQDAMQMSRATSRFFKHNNPDHLRKILERERSRFNGCLVVTEGVFSMDGDVAKLDEIYALAREFNARILVDEAHCFGVLGQHGLGVVEKYDLTEQVDIIMGTFSKIAGGIGGFTVGSKNYIDWLRAFGKSRLFSVSLPPSTVAGVIAALDVFQGEPERLQNLRSNISHFVEGLRQLGYPISREHESAVIPVVIKDEEKLGKIYQSLLEDGVLVTPVVYPAVSRTNCRLRFTVMATHNLSDLDFVLMSLEKALMKNKLEFSARENRAAS